MLARPASVMDAGLEKILGHQKTAYSAIIIVWDATERNVERLAQELAAEFLKPTFPDPLVSSSVTIGFKSGGFNRTIEIFQFKAWQRRATLGSALVSIDADFDVPDDEGLQIKVDVNTKPQITNPPKSAFSAIIPVLLKAVETDLPPLITPQIVAALPR